MLPILLLLIAPLLACHPECGYVMVENPVCIAECRHVCKPPVCQYQCLEGYTCDSAILPSCRVVCPPDQCESDACPACETICDPSDRCMGCSPLCEETRCTWQCFKPRICPLPRFEYVCELPACADSVVVVVVDDEHRSWVGAVVASVVVAFVVCAGLMVFMICLP